MAETTPEAPCRSPERDVARVVWPVTESVPIVAVCENRFVELAVVEKKLVVVPAVRERLPSVARPVTPKVEESVVAPEAASVPTLAACE